MEKELSKEQQESHNREFMLSNLRDTVHRINKVIEHLEEEEQNSKELPKDKTKQREIIVIIEVDDGNIPEKDKKAIEQEVLSTLFNSDNI